jgi:undecaprenyl-diphosphatase
VRHVSNKKYHLWLVILSVVFFVLSTTVAFTPESQMEREVMMRLHTQASPLTDAVMRVLTDSGSTPALLIIGAALSLLLWKHSGHHRPTLTLWLSLVLSEAFNLLIKFLLYRQRPQLWTRLVTAEYYSFPSGHAMVSTTFYGMAAYLLSQAFPQWRWLWWSLMIPFVMLIGLSRIWFGVHWPSDIAAGFIGGMIVLIGLTRWHNNREARQNIT